MGTERDRVIFAEEALFVSPSATGFHYTGVYGAGLPSPPMDVSGGFALYSTPPYPVLSSLIPGPRAEGWDCGEAWPPWNPGGTDPDYAPNQGSIVSQLKRIQSISYGFNTDRTDVNQYGHLSRLDAIQITQAPVNLEFSYYLLDGYNERHIGLVIDGTTFPLATEVSGSDGRNYFIETVPAGRDVVRGDLSIPDNEKTVIGIGNGFVTNYSVDLSVNTVPSATVTVEAYNIQANLGTTGINVPAIDPRNGALMSDAWEDGQPGVCKTGGCMQLFSLPPASKYYDGCGDVAALRPGDLVVDLRNASVLSQQVSSGDSNADIHGSAHLQSATIDFPLSRTDLGRVGITNPYTKALDFPITVTLSISAILADLKKGKLTDLLCDCGNNLVITLYDPSCPGCTRTTSDIALQYTFNQASLISENFSSTIGDNKTVDLVFSAQVG